MHMTGPIAILIALVCVLGIWGWTIYSIERKRPRD